MHRCICVYILFRQTLVGIRVSKALRKSFSAKSRVTMLIDLQKGCDSRHFISLFWQDSHHSEKIKFKWPRRLKLFPLFISNSLPVVVVYSLTSATLYNHFHFILHNGRPAFVSTPHIYLHRCVNLERFPLFFPRSRVLLFIYLFIVTSFAFPNYSTITGLVGIWFFCKSVSSGLKLENGLSVMSPSWNLLCLK